jgi:hypothetical protein
MRSDCPPAGADAGLAVARRRGLAALVLALLPAVAAIWAVPGFVTQDGPAHLYNAHILVASLGPASPFRDVFAVRWQPLPNWAGHLMLMGLMTIVPPRAADRALMTVTLVGLSAAIVWLRWRVAGWRGMPQAAALAVVLGLNVTWLFGFYSFLLGACLFPITLGVWWEGRERMGSGRALAVGGLCVLGYFCHLVSLGLTAVGLIVLAATTPGPLRRRRLAWTAASLAPVLPLALVYRRLTAAGGAMQPEWGVLAHPGSWRAWVAQLGWADPISLGSKLIVPFSEGRSPWAIVLAPVSWLAVALALLVFQTLRPARDAAGAPRLRRRRGWAVLAALLLLGGLLGPDSFGRDHGHYLPQRVALLGLVALVPWLDFGVARWPGRLAGLALAAAVVGQSAFVWDYAVRSDRRAAALLRAGPVVGRDQRVGTLLVGIRGGYRSNPLLHVDNLLGVGTGNVLWSNYETRFYYFPVQVRPEVRHPPALEFETVAILDGPDNASPRADRWGRLLANHRDQIDVLVVWGSDPALDALNDRWFRTVYREDPVRVLRRR